MDTKITKVAIKVNEKTIEVPTVVKSKAPFAINGRLNVNHYDDRTSFIVANFAPDIKKGCKVNAYLPASFVVGVFREDSKREGFALKIGRALIGKDRTEVTISAGIRHLLKYLSACGEYSLSKPGDTYIDAEGEERSVTVAHYRLDSLSFSWGEHLDAFKRGDVKHFVEDVEDDTFEATDFAL